VGLTWRVAEFAGLTLFGAGNFWPFSIASVQCQFSLIPNHNRVAWTIIAICGWLNVPILRMKTKPSRLHRALR
jgi:hypothetical protein